MKENNLTINFEPKLCDVHFIHSKVKYHDPNHALLKSQVSALSTSTGVNMPRLTDLSKDFIPDLIN